MTLKDAVDKYGFPLYVELDPNEAVDNSSPASAIILGEFNDGSTKYVYISGDCWVYPMGMTVTYFEVLKEDCSLEPTVQSKVNTDMCTCQTLLFGHHQECKWKP